MYYSMQFRKDIGATIQTLIDLGNKVNAMTLAHAKQLGLQVWRTDVGAQKIDGSLLWTFGMVIAGFQVKYKLGKVRLFQKSFLLAETSIEVVLGMLFLTLRNANI